MKLLVINNLASGYGEGAIYDFIRLVAQDGDEVVLRSTDGTTDLRTFLSDAADFDVVVASGGDGTVSTVCYLLAGSGIPILPFPAGTANLMALNLQLPTEPHALAKLVREGSVLPFDLGEIEVNGNRYGFGMMAGAGYDAAIMRSAEKRKRLLGPMAYFQAAVANANARPSRFRLVVDGREVESEGLGILVVNFSKIQFDLSVTHDNLPRDGYLDVAILKTESALGLLPAVGAAMLDRTGDFPDRGGVLEFYRGQTVSIEADPPMDIQYDGEVSNLQTPFSVRILPNAAQIIVSEEGYKLFGGHEAEAGA